MRSGDLSKRTYVHLLQLNEMPLNLDPQCNGYTSCWKWKVWENGQGRLLIWHALTQNGRFVTWKKHRIWLWLSQCAWPNLKKLHTGLPTQGCCNLSTVSCDWLWAPYVQSLEFSSVFVLIMINSLFNSCFEELAIQILNCNTKASFGSNTNTLGV